MEIDLVQGSIKNIPVDTVIVNLFHGTKSLGGAARIINDALDNAIQDLIMNGDINGELGEIGILYSRGEIPAKRILIVGLGKKENLSLEVIRTAAGAVIKRARDLNASEVATIVHGAGEGAYDVSDATQATIEGSLLALYRYDAPKIRETPVKQINALKIVEFDESKIDSIKQGITVGKAVVDGVYLARNLVNNPPNIATPKYIASIAKTIATKYDMELTIGDRKWAETYRMGAFLAVAQGAGEEPQFIVLEHNGKRKDLETVVLVGKGITFDSGGISLKKVKGMESMKSDMAGAAAVLGAMNAIGELNLPLRIIGIMPCTENKPDGRAYLPSDVITASNGRTIEIISTDAEGRMILADGLVYASRFNPHAVIDLATLTGACVIALGRGVSAGLFGNDDGLVEKLRRCGEIVNERVWPLPLFEDYRRTIDSKVADIKNAGGRYGGVGTSAAFLREFIEYNWAHIDMAGMAMTEKESYYTPSGATGYGVRLLVELLRSW